VPARLHGATWYRGQVNWRVWRKGLKWVLGLLRLSVGIKPCPLAMLPPNAAGLSREEAMALIAELKSVQDRLEGLRDGLRRLVEEEMPNRHHPLLRRMSVRPNRRQARRLVPEGDGGARTAASQAVASHGPGHAKRQAFVWFIRRQLDRAMVGGLGFARRPDGMASDATWRDTNVTREPENRCETVTSVANQNPWSKPVSVGSPRSSNMPLYYMLYYDV